ncbi:MAG TPA: hypothetical protein VHD56_12130 [Tepidisphaeraceae bacterium]|nr:hypothetical protein [Tepidisphaeraceae bacterium]
MTLDYRFPTTGAHRVQQVLVELKNEAELDWGIALAKLVLGVPLCFLGSFIVTCLTIRLYGRRIWMHGELFLPIFVGASVLTIPVFFYIQYHRPREFLWEVVREKFDFPNMILQVLLLGPKLILSVIEQLKTDEDASDETLALAARIVVQLIDAGQSVDIQQLHHDGPVEEFTKALQLLERRGWIGIAHKRNRVWLGSSIQRQFANLR